MNEKLSSLITLLEMKPDDPQIHRAAAAEYMRMEEHRRALLHYKRAAELGHDDGDLWYRLGVSSKCSGDLDTAREAFIQATQRGCTDPGLYTAFAALLLHLGNHSLAVTTAEAGLDSSPDDRWRSLLYSILADCYQANGSSHSVLQYRILAADSDPDNSVAQYNLAVLYWTSGDSERAAHYLQKSLAGNAPAPAWHLHGILSAHRGLLAQSVEMSEKALAMGYDPPDLRIHLAWSYRRLGDAASGISHALAGLESAQHPAELERLHSLAGLCLRDLGLYERALGHCSEAVRLGPMNPENHYNLGVIYNLLGDFFNSVKSLQCAVGLDAESHETWSALAHASERAGNLQLSVTALEQVVRIKPEDLTARRQLAWVLHSSGRHAEAIAHATFIADQFESETDQAVMHAVLGYWLAEGGNAQDAIRHCHQAMERSHSDPWVWYYSGRTYNAIGDQTAAVAYVRMAVQLAGANPEYRYVLAEWLLEDGQFAEAESLLRGLICTDERGNAMSLLVKSAIIRGQFQEASTLAEEWVAMEPDVAAAWDALAEARWAIGDEVGAMEAKREHHSILVESIEHAE